MLFIKCNFCDCTFNVAPPALDANFKLGQVENQTTKFASCPRCEATVGIHVTTRVFFTEEKKTWPQVLTEILS